jgi:ABC-type branched-subunit amino acid transport system substrate-binding protein
MRGSRFGVAVLGVVVVVVAAAGIPASGAMRAAKPKADDVGISDTEIRVAVIADVDNAIVPGLFQSAVDVMNAWAKTVNKQGGLAGRKVVIDFIDSRLNPAETRNATIKACADDFAVVGGAAIFMSNVDDLVNCENSKGEAIGIPDLPGIALDPAQQCSPVQFRYQGITSLHCDTRAATPPTYSVQKGDSEYYLSRYGKLHGIWTLPAETPTTRNADIAAFEAGVDAGMVKDGEGFYDVSARSQQSELTPLIQTVKRAGSNWVFNGTAPGIMALLRKEAVIQGVDSVKVWACNQGCYDGVYLDQAGAEAEGTHATLQFLPFYTDYKSNASLRTLAKAMGGVDKLSGNGVSTWLGALLFQDAVQKAVATGKPLTRQTLLDALKDEHSFDAQGIVGPADVGNHQISPCFAVAQVKNGKWVREYPKKVGTFDCKKSNIVDMKAEIR